jgi:hypothetical protein
MRKCWLVFVQSSKWLWISAFCCLCCCDSVTRFLISFVILLIGLAFCGAPVWLVLHATGRRRWQNAVVAGALVPFIVSLAFTTRFFTGRASGQWSYYGNGGDHWIDGKITMFGITMALQSAAQLAAIGALVGLVIWRVAYRRIEGSE